MDVMIHSLIPSQNVLMGFYSCLQYLVFLSVVVVSLRRGYQGIRKKIITRFPGFLFTVNSAQSCPHNAPLSV